VTLKIWILIFGFESFLEEILSIPDIQMFWNDIKEIYGKEVDEQELYKVFKFYAFIIKLESALEEALKYTSPINFINDGRGYEIYRKEKYLDGKLDEETFKELAKKMWEYLNREEFYEKYKQDKEQKDEQSK